MPAFLRDRFLVVWAFLVAVTLLSSAIGAPGGLGLIGSPAVVTFAVLAIAFVKVWLVMFNFMDVRRAPFALRALCTGWSAIALGVLLAIYAGVFR